MLWFNLDDAKRIILGESVEQGTVMDAIDNRTRVYIDYSDEDNNAPGQRLIEPYALGITRAGNLALRAYQYQGSTLRGIPKWKLFRLDRITKWRKLRNSIFNQQPSDQGWDAPPYNEKGDNTLVSVIDQVKFDDEDDGLYQPTLNKLRKQTDTLKKHTNAMDLSKLDTMPKGPVKQKKKNVFTSQPNSKKYKKYQQNIKDTERDEVSRSKYWGDFDKAEQEKNAQNALNNKDYEMDNLSGPIKHYNSQGDEYDVKEEDYEDNDYFKYNNNNW